MQGVSPGTAVDAGGLIPDLALFWRPYLDDAVARATGGERYAERYAARFRELADSGKGVIVISSEMPELLGICDRIYTLSEGTITVFCCGLSASLAKASTYFWATK